MEKAQGRAFDREASLQLKGVAILMMLFHHLFYKAELSQGHAVSFFPLSVAQGISVGSFCKICVSIYAFISGYGLFLSYVKFSGGGGYGDALVREAVCKDLLRILVRVGADVVDPIDNTKAYFEENPDPVEPVEEEE